MATVTLPSRSDDLSGDRSIFDAVNDAIFLHDPASGAILDVNLKMTEMYGITREEACTLTVQDLSGGEPPFGPDQATDRIRLAASGTPQMFEWLARHRDGHTFWVEVSIRRVAIGGKDCMVAVVRDIADRKAAEQAARRERDFVAEVLETAASLVVVLDREGCIVGFNRACTELSGYTFEEVRGKPFWDLLAPDETSGVEEVWRQLLAGGRRIEHENHWRPKHGGPRLIAWSNSTLFNEQGELEHVIATGVDVTEERRAQAALRDREEQYRRLVETANEGIWSIDAANRITFANSQMTRITGYSMDELIGLPVFSLVDPGSHALVASRLEERRHGVRNRYEVQLRRKDGAAAWVIVSGSPTFDPDGCYSGALGLLTDITARKKAEDELQRALDEMESRVAARTSEIAAANDVLMVRNAELRRQKEQLAQQAADLNAAAVERERLLRDLEGERRSLQTLIDQMPEGVLLAEAPDGQVVMANAAARHLLGRDVPLGTRVDQCADAFGLLHADGRVYAAADLPISRALRGEVVTRQEVVVRRPDGSELPVMVNCVAADTAGRCTAIAVFQDVTAIKEAARVREEFVQLISHDLRNPLAVIMGHAQRLRQLTEQRGADDEMRHTEAISKSAAQIHALLQDLVDSTRIESGQLSLRTQRTDLPLLVAEIAERAGRTEDRGRLTVVAGRLVPPVRIDPDRFERVVVNLLTNALKYSPPSAPVLVRVDTVDQEVRLSVTDRGIGIAPADLPHVFDRFYRVRSTTSPEGLGLGLYITRLIVEAHRGRIWCESRLGEGSTFHVALPVADPSTP